eukprot:1466551-Pyramimonas_sp.AAC.1
MGKVRPDAQRVLRAISGIDPAHADPVALLRELARDPIAFKFNRVALTDRMELGRGTISQVMREANNQLTPMCLAYSLKNWPWK